MALKRVKTKEVIKKHKDILLENYEHVDKKRKNNPEAGLVNSKTDKNEGRTKYAYDPHLDPTLQWAGKKERASFDVANVSLHVHERIDPKTIARSFIKEKERSVQPSLFDVEREMPLSKAVHFYSHDEQWANRLIAGDSLLVMNSLLYKEGMAGKVQMIYIDPPYGIKYNSNFQPFTNKRDVKDNNDADIPAEPEMIKAFRDTWELGIHSYLTYLRDRLLLARELLTDSGSIFVQISDENIHHVKELMDEVFGVNNFVKIIGYKTNSPLGESFLPNVFDFILWYAKDKKQIKFRKLFSDKEIGEGTLFSYVELPDGTRRTMTLEERMKPFLLPKGSKPFFLNQLSSSGYTASCFYDFEFEGKVIKAKKNSWKTNKRGMQTLIEKNRLYIPGGVPYMIGYYEDFPVQELSNIWTDTRSEMQKIYAVQTQSLVIQRCLLMSTDPGDMVFDPTCGSGTTAYIAEKWGRRWITCDTSRVAITLAKQRLMTAQFDYLELAHPAEGIKSGFRYRTVKHVTLGAIANNESSPEEVLYDQPIVVKDIVRSTGPFTVEAVPSARVLPFDGKLPDALKETDLARTGESALYQRWIDELKITGIRAVGGRSVEFARIAHKEGSAYIQAEGDVNDAGELSKSNILFGGDFGPLDQIAVEKAIEETIKEKDRAKYLIFAAFQFDPEAAKDIDVQAKHLEEQYGITVLKAQMNVDLLTEDLRKKRSSNESYWLIGQPSVEVISVDNGKFQIKLNGFDYYNPATAEMESRGVDHVAFWMIDTDYDDRSVFPTQVFFPQADNKRDWTKLAKALNGRVDEELLEFFSSDTSLPFSPGEHKKIAVKIIDNRGIESLVIRELK